MRQSHQAVVITLDLVALDPPVEDDYIGARCQPKLELLNYTRLWVSDVT